MQTRARMLAVGAVVVLAIGYLMLSGFSQATSYYVNVDELRSAGAVVNSRSVRVMGKIVGDTVRYDANQTKLTFQIMGDSGDRVTVEYMGIQPDNMNDQWEAIVEGNLSPDGTLQATKVMIKCPSLYEGEQESPE